MNLTLKHLIACTGAKQADAEKYLPFLQGTMKVYDIDTPQRVAGFLSQISHESAALSTVEENLNYSVDALLKMFGRHRISEADARAFGRAPGRPANQEAIANALYGGAWGLRNLGNSKPGDGWKFRGRGLKQLTGRANYTRCGNDIGEDFANHPERLLMPVNAALSAGWFWSANGLNEVADRGDIAAMTKRINGGDFGLKERTALYVQGMGVFT